MARLTSEELQEAKRRKALERGQEAEQQRLEDEREEAESREAQKRAEERMACEDELKQRHGQLDSYVNGIYDEVSKLNIKWPTSDVSALTVDRTNRAVKTAKQLLADENDPFIDEIQEFVPAGDLPQARDVVITLRQVKDALQRMDKRHQKAWRGY